MAGITRGVLTGNAIVRRIGLRRQCVEVPGAAALAALAVAALGLTGCGMVGDDSPTALEVSANYLGSVAADDPQAVDVGQRTLSNGGRAADAAAAMGFALTVSLPSRAGIDGSGVCLVHDAGQTTVDEVDFVPPQLPDAALQIPGMVRGLAELQARHGRRRWQEAIGMAEKLGQNGIAVTGQLLADLQAAGLSATNASGVPLKPGDVLPQTSVSTTLGLLRVDGPSSIYTGRLASLLVSNGVPADRLASWVPTWKQAVALRDGDRTLFVSGRAATAAQAAWQALVGQTGIDPAAALARGRAAASAIDQPGATTGFTAIDSSGSAVSCVLGMGKLFGTGRTLEGLAIYAAAPSDATTLGTMAPAISVAANGSLVAAFSGSGGTAAPADTASAGWLVLAGAPLDQVLAAKRNPAEDSAHPAVDRIDGIACPGGGTPDAYHCVAAADLRGSGYAMKADRLIK